MALNRVYSIIDEEIAKCGKEIFISLSIAPLFPYFLGHARRCCCDSFGHYDDVRYVLNALNFAVSYTHLDVYKRQDMQQPESTDDVYVRCKPYAQQWEPAADRIWAEKHGSCDGCSGCGK